MYNFVYVSSCNLVSCLCMKCQYHLILPHRTILMPFGICSQSDSSWYFIPFFYFLEILAHVSIQVLDKVTGIKLRVLGWTGRCLWIHNKR